MHLKVFLKLKKTWKLILLGKYIKKKQKNQKKPQKNHWAGFKKKPWFFPTLTYWQGLYPDPIRIRIRNPVSK